MNKSIVTTTMCMLMGLLTSCSQTDVSIQTPSEITYKLQPIVEELEIPWGTVFLPDGSLLITEKNGTLIQVSTNTTNTKDTITGLPEIYQRGQGGLMDIELHPDYEENGWIYFSYASEEGESKGGHTAIGRAQLSGNTLINFKVLYKGSPNTKNGRHFGSRIVFDNDNYLYFSIGDRGNRDVNPQNIAKDGGKIYRLHDDGRVPKDNPFVGDNNAKKAIYSYGHRNPQGMILHPTGKIWIHEHGPRGGDEINIVQKGLNYGWPKITYGVNYSGTNITKNKSLPGLKQPLYYWIPSIAPSGMIFLEGNIYPEWQESIFVGSLKFSYLERLKMKENKVILREKIAADIGRVRDVFQDTQGYLYIAVENKGIFKIVPAN